VDSVIEEKDDGFVVHEFAHCSSAKRATSSRATTMTAVNMKAYIGTEEIIRLRLKGNPRNSSRPEKKEQQK
jgi:hypothetical protein